MTATTAHRDFFHWPYAPPQPPGPDAADGGDLLLVVADALGCGGDWRRLVAAARAELGLHQVVWCVRQAASAVSAEVYAYSAPSARTVPLARFLRALSGFADCPITLPDALHYGCVSVELPMQPGAFPVQVGEVDVYFHTPGTDAAGTCHRVTAAGAEFKNSYATIRPGAEAMLAARIIASPHGPRSDDAMRALVPECVAPCRYYVQASKRDRDGLYFAGLDGERLVAFLDYHRWPAAVVQAVRDLTPRMRHLLHDIGFDYVAAGGAPAVTRTAFFGVF